MQGVIKKIILSAERSDNEVVDYENLNTDVIVQFDTGDQYVTTFYSYKWLEKMIEKHRASKENRSDRHYEILDIVVVNDLKDGNLLPVVEQMVAEGDFQLAFKKI